MATPPVMGLDPVTNQAQPMFAALRAQFGPSTRMTPRARSNKTVDASPGHPPKHCGPLDFSNESVEAAFEHLNDYRAQLLRGI